MPASIPWHGLLDQGGEEPVGLGDGRSLLRGTASVRSSRRRAIRDARMDFIVAFMESREPTAEGVPP